MGLVRTSDAASEPVTTAEQKTFMRVDGSDEDTFIDTLIAAARCLIEEDTRRAFITQTWQLTLNAFPSDGSAIELPRPPLSSVTSIAYVDSNGDSQTWSSSEYSVDTSALVGRVKPAYGYSYPSTRSQMDAVTITYVAGYGAASAVPALAKLAIKMVAANWFENREPVVVGMTPATVPVHVDRVMGPLRIPEAPSVGEG